MAEWVKASFLQQPWSNDLGSTRTLVMLLRFWIRRFTMIISAWYVRTSSKFSGQKFEEIHRNVRSSETPMHMRIPPITKQSMQWKARGSSNKLAASDAVRWQEDKYALQPWQLFLWVNRNAKVMNPALFCNAINMKLTKFKDKKADQSW